ncbi:MAG: HdeD family acid-resistance protein [Actinomycetota bacterium]
MSMMQREMHEIRTEMARWWWVFLLTGIAWILFSLMILQFDLRSATAIGFLAGFMFIVAGFNEFAVMAMVGGWKWLHALLGILFIVTGVMAVAWPNRTFVIVANLVAWFLLFKGTFDIVIAFATRGQELWWVQLIAGILNVVIAFWAAGYPGRSAVLLILWVGISSLTRGVTELVLAFQLRGLKRDSETPAMA